MRLTLFFLCLCLSACADRSSLAPVEELHWQGKKGQVYTHTVQRGETLYAIAFRYDRDYRSLAAYNHLQNPYALKVGQVLKINSSYYVPQARPVYSKPRQTYYSMPVRKMNTKTIRTPKELAPHLANGRWQWPAQGRVAGLFAPAQGKKGIDIAGSKGALVKAAASGTVAYAGNGLTGYGNLIIIKHDGQLLTAYANNLKNRVHEGQYVKAGQTIAEMGIIERQFWGVHFEIRKAGQPVNPLNYLPKGE